MPFGSSACLSERINAIASAPCSCSRNSRLPRPMPCSPLQVPPSARARATIVRSSSQARSISAGSSLLTRITVWKLPSPTCPTMGAEKPLASMSALAPSRASARREMGTQTSVVIPRLPGAEASAAQ